MSDSVSNYDQAIEFLFNRINYERASVGSYSTEDLKLGRMRELLERLENPQAKLPAVHLAGTKGKGSTATMLANVLKQAGYKTGLFTSPHIHAFEERFVVNGCPPTQAELVTLVNELLPILNEMDQLPGEMAPTYFEIATALAWMHFLKQNVDIVVLETGLGGRLDTTKLCQPLVTIITCISLDHTNLLGETVEEIAAEKAGILKPGVPFVSGVLEPKAQQVTHQAAQEVGAPLIELGQEVQLLETRNVFDSESGLQTCVKLSSAKHPELDLQLGLPGSHQGHNAALVLAACEQLQQAGWNISTEQLQAGLASVSCPLRTEMVQTEPYVVLDAAHNVASIEALIETVRLIPATKKRVLFSTSRDKQTKLMLEQLKTFFDEIVLTEFQSNPRVVLLEELVQLANKVGFKSVSTIATPIEAWEKMENETESNELICVTGSFFLASEIREKYFLN